MIVSSRTLVALVLLAALPLAAQQTGAKVVASKRDASTTAFGAQPIDLPLGSKPGTNVHEVKKLPPLPPKPKGSKKAAPAASVLQTTATATLKVAAPATFPGIGDGVGQFRVAGFPSDTTGAIGATQYVQWVNTALQVFNRDGSSAYGPTLGRALWKGFGGRCETLNDGDPIVQYDKAANRWVLSQFAVNDGPPFLECVAVSQTSDATGKYFRYAYEFENFNDYPKVGIWPDAYYFTFNMFDANERGIGSRVCAMPRAKMLAGDDAPMQCFDLNDFGLLPADLDGATQPAAGTPELLMNFTRDALQLWKMHIDFDDPSKSTLSAPVTIAVASFDPACDSCVPQKGTPNRLDTLSDRLMYRLAYRRLADHDALVVNHAVDVAGSAISGVRWYEIRDPFGAPAVAQQGTYAPGSTARWIGSVAMDKMGNLLVGYSASSNSQFPSVMIAGRQPADPKGKLSKEVKAVAGSAAQTGFTRWGDYSSMTLDPTDDCTFWFTTELQDKNHKRWQTSVVHTKFSTCN